VRLPELRSYLGKVLFLVGNARRKLVMLLPLYLLSSAADLVGIGLLACALGWAGSQAWESWVGHVGKLRQIGAVFVPASLAGIAYVSLGLALRMGPAREIHAGSGYGSVDASRVVLSGEARAVWVRWPGGKAMETPVAAGTAEIEVVEPGER
jgi:hypothetical protein